MNDLPLDMERELAELGLIPKPKHAPIKKPKKPPVREFRRPVFDENGEPDF